ncbi:MAG: hypothetical protein R6V72_01190 [Cyclobacterium sp.]|uniref:hypothetical protein n=1 Tax=unclassified Cyclobacterium TaxID=2615055 RepID=UPI0013D38755|nr:hypothetical protein [Cyclobacterium sp. SYSU L10401]
MTENTKDKLDTEFGVDSRYSSEKERKSDAAALMEARLRRMKNLSKEKITKAKLMQLKLRMDEYIKHPAHDNHSNFLEFLKSYIDTLYSKRSDFARDIAVTSVSLSQVINKHREPKEEFLLKLMIHSEKVYAGFCAFPKEIWYQVYYHEKICNTMSNQKEWRPEIEKDIRVSAVL